MKYNYLLGSVLGILLAVVFGSCSDTRVKNQFQNSDTSHIVNTNPSSIIKKRTIENFWDDFDFNDEELCKRDGEQSIADFIGYFPSSSQAEIQKSVFRMLSQAENNPKAFALFQDLFRKYLYDPNSPFRNDMYYEWVLSYLVRSEAVSSLEKSKYLQLLKTVQKNKEGTQASMFSVMLSSGEMMKLSDVHSPFLLLMFYEPDCSSCKTIIEKMKNIPELNELIDNKKSLKILAVYAVGNEEIWRDYFPHMPVNWINSIDKKQNIIKNNIYDLKASPTMYLLDQRKQVILKDTDLGKLMYFFTTKGLS
ncbi:DUF5106 domain-containing protein [Sphingobacterium spiritivorum]|uniref:DUF5106 domain-containing protein n=1 Tax=Sphingobacterium spiritivorum TaxID=258 RepID=UPI003DA61E5A